MTNATTILGQVADTSREALSTNEVPFIGGFIDSIAQAIQPVIGPYAQTQLGAFVILILLLVGFVYALRRIPKVLAVAVFLLIILIVLRALALG